MFGTACRICSLIDFAERNDQPIGSKDRAEFIGPFGLQDKTKRTNQHFCKDLAT